MRKIITIFHRAVLRIKNYGLIESIKYFPEFLIKSKKIDLDAINLKDNISLDNLCFIFGTDKAFLDRKKTFYKLNKDSKFKKKFPNYESWINERKFKLYKYELGLNYAKFYEKYFADLKYKKLKILEIGVAAGHSLAAWYKYFPNSQIYGIDIKDKTFLLYKGKRLRYDIIDCLDTKSIKKYCKEFGKFDLIIDDSFHDHPFFEMNIKNFFPYLNSGGIYFLEDFLDMDKKLKSIRQYNLKYKKKLMWGFEVTMHEKFGFFKKKKIFNDQIFTKKDLRYIYKYLKKVNVHYPGHPVSSLAAMIKK